MAFRLGADATNNIRTKTTNAAVQALDAGTTNANATLLIYSGSQPATPQTVATGTLLATLNFHNASFAAADANGTAGLFGGTALTATVAASGTAGWFRVLDRDNHAMFDGAITATGGGGDMTFDNVTFVSGGTVNLNSMTYTTPM